MEVLSGDSLKLIEKAVETYRRGTQSRWEFCELAATIVGKRIKGATKAIAERCGISASQVENYARAGVLWSAAAREYPESRDELDEMRRALPISHWVTMADAWVRYEFPLHEGLALLQEMAQSDTIPTVTSLRSMLEGMFAPQEAVDAEWRIYLRRGMHYLREAADGYGAPEALRRFVLDDVIPGLGLWEVGDGRAG